MLDDDGPTDLSQLAVPQVGSFEATGDPFQPYWFLDTVGVPIPAADAYFAELVACGRSSTTLRSYGMDLLRQFRFLSAVGVDWKKATCVEGRDFCRWFMAAPRPARQSSIPSSPPPSTSRPRCPLRRPRRRLVPEASSRSTRTPSRLADRGSRLPRHHRG